MLVGLVVSVSATTGQTLQPDPGSAVLLKAIEFRFPGRERSNRDIAIYVQQIEVARHVSQPRRDYWVAYREAEPFIVPDAQRLWLSGQFETLWVEVRDDPYENGVMAKRLIFNLVERADVAVPAADDPTLPVEYRVPPPGYERLYPIPER